jgi:hypothetical protein
MRISFELDDDDLRHFRLIMDESRKAARRMAPEDIVAAAEELLTDAPNSKFYPGTPGATAAHDPDALRRRMAIATQGRNQGA